MKKTLFTIVIILAALLPQSIMAQEPYAVLDGTTLTFYYDNNKPSDGMSVGPFTTTSGREWNNYAYDIRTVEFNATFANCTTLESTAYWFSELNNLTTINGIAYLNTTNVTSMEAMFARCTALQEIDLSHFDTKNVETMANMFFSCYALTSLNLSAFNTTKVKKMQGMFNGCSQLTSLSVGNFKTDNVTHMGYMFSSCSNLTTLDLSGFNTEEVLDMGGMFSDCSLLTTINLSGFNTEKVLDMSHMFYNCQNLTSLDLSDFKTDKVLGMNNMFSGCTSLTTIYVDGGWSTKSLNDGNNMFYNCTSLVGGAGTTYNGDHTNNTYAHIDGGTNNPGYLTDIREPYAILSPDSKTLTFYYDKYKEDNDGMDLTYTPWRDDETKDIITKVVFDATFADCTSLTTTESWFNECTNLATIENMGNLNTEHVTNMSAMFRMCTSLTSIDFENFNTSNATTLDNMFFGCTGLTNLDLSHFNTANVEDMHSMFAGCTKLTTLDLSHFETSSLTNIQGMFSGCELLETVDLSSWNTANVTDVRFLFNYCTSLTTVYVGSTWDLSSVTTEMGSYVFNNCNNIGGGQGTSYSSSHIDHTYARIDDPDNGNPGYFTDVVDKDKVLEPYAALNEDNTVLTFYYDRKKEIRDGMDIGPFINGSGGPLWTGNDITSVVFDKSFANYSSLTSTACWFYELYDLTSITGIENLKTENVTDMTSMFYHCFSLTNLDLSGFNTANVTSMSSMFWGCSNLNSLNLSGFNTANVSYMGGMFNNCSGLTSLDVSGFNTANVTYMGEMFYNCSRLTNLDVSGFNTANVTNMNEMFYGCSGLTSLDVSGFNTANVTNMSNMFYGCSGLTSLDVSGFNTANATDMSNMFYGCSGLTSLDVSGFNTANITDMSCMFYGCSGLTSLNVSNFTTGKVTDMRAVFQSCSGLTTLDVSNFNTGNVTHMASLFRDCSGLTTLDVSNFNTAKVTNMANLFDHCSSLTTLDLSNFTTTNVKFMDNMFYYCSGLTSLNVSGFDTGNVTNMSNMFYRCSSLTDLNVRNFNTSNVKDMSYMFYNCSNLTNLDLSNFVTDKVTDMRIMFYNCSSLTSLDLSGFNTANVTDMSSMFANCSSLKTVFVGDTWSTANVISSTTMFYSCKAIVGGAGTFFDTEKTNKNYARIDGGPTSDTPGYFTRSGEAPYVAEAYAVLTENDDYVTIEGTTVKGKTLTFHYDNKKAENNGLEVGPFNEYGSRGWDDATSTITSVVFDDLFKYCNSLTSTASWFYNCNNMTSITGLKNLKTGNVTDMSNMFYRCSRLTNLEISNFNTDNVTNMASMFSGCSGLASLDLTSFNTLNVTDMSAMFYDCSGLTSLDLSIFNTAKVTSMSDMFVRCSGLKNLYLSNFNNDNVENMSNMFFSCTGLTNLDLSGFKTPSVTNMHEMFWGCSGLMSLDLSGFNTSKVTDMGRMFEYCSGLTSIDLSGCNTENVTNMHGMFWQCSGLKTIYVGSEWTTTAVTDSGIMFEYCSKLIGGQGTKYTGSKTDATYARIDNLPDNPGYFTRSGDEPYIEPEAYAALSDNNTVLTFYYNKNKGEDAFDVKSFNSITDRGWNDVSSNITKVVFDASFAECTTLTSTAYWFEGFSSLTTFEGSNLVTSRVTNMTAMFSGCSSLTSLDVSSFNTVNVTNMTSMFQDCSNLQTISVGRDWITKKSTNGNNMFSGCTSLVGGAGTSFNSSAVNHYYAHVDGGADNPGYFTLSADAPTKSPEPYALLSDDGKVLSIYYDDMKSSHIILNMISIDEGFMYNNIGWPYGTSQTVTTVIFDPSFADCRLKNLNSMFHGFNKLSEINGIDYLNTSEVTDMYSMFDSCEKLSKIDLSHFNTSNVTRMRYMFRYCTSLTTLNLSSFNTSKLSDISLMFFGDEMLRTIYVGSGWNTSKITDSNNLSSVFEYCEVLRGGKGTKYDASKYEYGDDIDGAYARIDDGSYFPGFFTDITEKGKENEPYAVLTENNDYVSTDEETVKGKTLTFYYDKNIVDRGGIDVGPFDSDYDSGWNGISNIITKVVFDDSFASCTSLTSTAYWFDDCPNLTSITGIERLNTDNVTDMNEMFWHCSSLTSLNVSNFNTSNVKNMEGMFTVCSGLKSIDISVFNTGKVTNMESMFAGCSSLTTIIVGSGWSTEAVKSSYYMFSGCSALVGGAGTPYDSSYEDATYARIDGGPDSDTPGYFTRSGDEPYKNPEPYAVLTDNDDYVTTDEGTLKQKTLTFYYDSHKESRGGMSVGPFALDSDMAWYNQTKSITTVVFDNSFANCTTLTSTAHWFERCSNISSILGIDNLKTDKVTNMARMFEYCSSLTSLDLSGFNTTNVSNLCCMFQGCSGLTNLDVTNFNTENVTDMSGMFGSCSGLTNLNVSGFKTDNVTDMSCMFSHCSSLKSLDLSGFNTESVTGMQAMFSGCSNLGTIYVGDKWNVSSVTYRLFVFEDCTALVGGAGTPYDPNHTDTEYARIDGGPDSDTPGYFTEKGPEAYAVLTDNEHVIYINEVPINGKTLTFYYDKNKTEREGMSVGPFETWTDRGWNDDRESITTVEFDTSFSKCTTLKSTAYWFEGCTNLTLFSGLDNLKTDNVEDMTCMFSNCFYLRYLDISGFNTGKVTSMMGMFYDCNFLETIFVGEKWNTDNLTNLGGNSMFSFCDRLVGGQGTKYADNYINDHTYAHIDEGTSNPGYFTDIKSPYPYAVRSDENTKVTFYFDAKRKERSGVWIHEWKKYYESITQVIFDDSFAEYKGLTSLDSWFAGCPKLTSIEGISNLNTDNVLYMSLMFYNCTGLTSLDLSSLNTSKVNNMGYMFAGCSNLESLNMSFDTGNVTSMYDMFYGCSKLKNIDLISFNTTNVENMGNMFAGCSSLTSLDLSNFNTGKVTDMSGMFSECSSLSNLNLSNFNTENVTTMNYMFYGCVELKSIDLSSFNTSKVIYDPDNYKYGILGMFSGCSALTTIYVGEGWNIENLTESTDVFKDCTALVGGAGTPYDQNHTDIEYARIDDPDNSKPGYFTKAGKLGDVNGDGFVNIADAQAMVSYILGTYEGTFNVSLADMNYDGVIDIFDVTLVVNITLEDDTNNPSGSRAFTRGDNSQAEMIRLKAEANNIYLSIDEAERFTAFQFDITLPEGVELTGVELAAGTTDHMLKFVKHRGNRYRVVGLSFTNELLATSDGKLIMLQVSDAVIENDVSIDNVLFVTPSNKVVTHIGGIEYNQQAEDDTIYNLSGQKLNVKRQQLSKGVYIINHKKVIIK